MELRYGPVFIRPDRLQPRAARIPATLFVSVLDWAALSAVLPRRDGCRRMVDLLWLAHDEGCEAELSFLIADSLGRGELPEARALREELEPRSRALPDDTPVALTDLASFDALLEGCA